MCGIFGARWSWLARVHGDPAVAAERALRQLQWRGPDGAALVRIGDYVLGCARLSITEPRSRQPLVLRPGRLAGVWNGAVTDARSWWAALRPSMAGRAVPANDAWLPILLCAAGRAVELAQLRGHGAAAVVDAATDTLWLCRDAAGEKPLFVVLADGGPVAFASTAPALRALGVAIGPGPAATANWFRYGFAAEPPLVATGGAIVVADLAGVHVSTAGGRLRRLAPSRGATATVSATESVPTVAAALAAATRRGLDAAPPVALALSGGIDSSCLAVEIGACRAGVPAYQFLARGEAEDERSLARAVAAHCGLELRTVDRGPEVLEALPRLTASWGLPLGDPSVLAVHALARAAADDGVRVLLSGEGADEGLLGYTRHRALRWQPPFRLPLPTLLQPRWSMRRGARLLRACAAADPFAALLEVTSPGLREDVLAAPSVDRPGDAMAVGRGAGRLQRAREYEFEAYLRHDLLPKLDVATMAAAVEGRCPFLDAEVRRAVAAWPAHHVLGKVPLRRAYAARLPAAVMRQRKRGFALPLDRWFRGDLPWLDLLRQARTQQRPHLRAGGLATAIDRHRRGGADLGRALYLVVAFELWLRSTEDTTCG